jgi:hypothetical protein
MMDAPRSPARGALAAMRRRRLPPRGWSHDWPSTPACTGHALRVEMAHAQVVTKSEARDIAYAHTQRLGLPWTEPIAVRWRPLSYFVWTHAGWTGGNVGIKVSKRTGRPRHVWGPLPR